MAGDSEIKISDSQILELIKEQAATSENIRTMNRTLQQVVKTLDKVATLEAHHVDTKAAVGRAFEGIEGVRNRTDLLDERMDGMEQWVPMLKNMRRLLYAASTTAVSSLIGALIYMMVQK